MKSQKKFKGKRVQSSAGFWLDKLNSQIQVIEKSENHKELEIALAFLFLYLFLEETIDYHVDNICSYSGRSLVKKNYQEKNRNLRSKLEFIFENFCQQLPYSDYVSIRDEVKEIIKIRNQIVHLEELSWSIEMSENNEWRETENNFVKLLTKQNLFLHCDDVCKFFENLKNLINRGLNYEKYPLNGSINGVAVNPSDDDPALANYMFQLSVPRLPNFKRK